MEQGLKDNPIVPATENPLKLPEDEAKQLSDIATGKVAVTDEDLQDERISQIQNQIQEAFQSDESWSDDNHFVRLPDSYNVEIPGYVMELKERVGGINKIDPQTNEEWLTKMFSPDPVKRITEIGKEQSVEKLREVTLKEINSRIEEEKTNLDGAMAGLGETENLYRQLTAAVQSGEYGDMQKREMQQKIEDEVLPMLQTYNEQVVTAYEAMYELNNAAYDVNQEQQGTLETGVNAFWNNSVGNLPRMLGSVTASVQELGSAPMKWMTDAIISSSNDVPASIKGAAMYKRMQLEQQDIAVESMYNFMEKASEAIMLAEDRDNKMASMTGQTLGQLVQMTAGAAIGGPATGMAIGAALSADEMLQQGLDAGMDFDTASLMSALYMPLGMGLEYAGASRGIAKLESAQLRKYVIDQILKGEVKANKKGIASAVGAYLKDVGLGTLEETVTETTQFMVQDLMQRGYNQLKEDGTQGYNTPDFFEGEYRSILGDNAGGGAYGGFLMSVVTSAMGARRRSFQTFRDQLSSPQDYEALKKQLTLQMKKNNATDQETMEVITQLQTAQGISESVPSYYPEDAQIEYFNIQMKLAEFNRKREVMPQGARKNAFKEDENFYNSRLEQLEQEHSAVVEEEAKLNEEDSKTETTSTDNKVVDETEPVEKKDEVKTEPVTKTEPQQKKEKPKPTTKTVKYKNSDYTVTLDDKGSVTEITNKKGEPIKKTYTRTIKSTGKKVEVKNPAYSKIEAEATGTLTQYDFKKERDEKVKQITANNTPNTVEEAVLSAFSTGAQVDRESIKREINDDKAMIWASGLGKKNPSIEAMAENIKAEHFEYQDDVTVQDIRNEIISTINGFKSKTDVQESLIAMYESNLEKQQQQEYDAYISSLSPQELSNLETMEAEDSMTPEEQQKYYEEESERLIDSLPEDQRQELYEQIYEDEKAINPEESTDSTGESDSSKSVDGNSSQKSDGSKTEKVTSQESTQERKSSKTNERIKPRKQKLKPDQTPKKLNEILADVAKALNATLRYGKGSKRRSLGTYFTKSALTKVKNAGDLDTAAHELGHNIDDRFDIYGSAQSSPRKSAINSQLNWFAERGGSNPPKNATKAQIEEYLKREGMAEFVRAYVVNPNETKRIAPQLTEHFENSVDKETLKAFKDFSNDVLTLYNSTAADQVMANIESIDAPNKSKIKEWIDGFKGKEGNLNLTPWDSFKVAFSNSMTIANKAFFYAMDIQGNKEISPDENFELLSRVFAGYAGKIETIFRKGLINSKNKTIKDSEGNVMNVDYLIEPLDTTSEKALKKEMDEVVQYMVAERTLEYAVKFQRTNNLTGIGAGLKTDLETAQATLDEFMQMQKDNPEKFKRIEEGARRYREFTDASLRYAVEKGRLSEEAYNTIKEGNQFYVSLARTKETSPMEAIDQIAASNKLSSVKDVIRKAKGGTDTIKNPYFSLLENVHDIIREADRNEVMRSFVAPLEVDRGMGDGEQVNMAQIGAKVAGPTPTTIAIYNDKGEKEYWEFSTPVYEALTEMGKDQKNILADTLKHPASLIRWSVTHWPVFAARNLVRDTFSRLVISRSVGHGIGQDKVKNAQTMYEEFGGSQAGFYMNNKEAYRQTMTDSITKLTKKGVLVLDPRKISLPGAYKAYSKFLQKGENVNRIAEFNSAYKKAKKQGMDDYNAGLYAAYQARDLMDFAVAGTIMRQVNKVIPFSNAAVQSVKRSVKGAKESPGRFAAKMALYTMAPQLVMRALAMLNDYEDEYDNLPDYQKDLYWNYKIEGLGWIAIPKPFELGIPSAMIDRMISKARGNKTAMDGSLMQSISAMTPFDDATLMGSFKPLIEAMTGEDTFRDKSIVPYWEKNLALDYRKGTKYASRLGKGMTNVFGLVGAEVDPRSIDHVVKGYLTYYGDALLTASDIGRNDSRYKFNLTKTGFIKNAPVGSAKSVSTAMDLIEKSGQERSKISLGLQGRIKAYYVLIDNPETTKEEAQAALDELYQYSKDIMPFLKAKAEFKLEEKELKDKYYESEGL